MKNAMTGIAAVACVVAALAGSATAKPMMAKGKMVPMYQAAICHMYFTPAQASKYHYACPDSKGTMHKVMVTPAVAHMQMAKTSKVLMGMDMKADKSHMAKGKMVTMYQAAICHMYFTPAQAKMYHYACPASKGKMHKVMVTPAVAHMQMAKTNKALMGMKKKSM